MMGGYQLFILRGYHLLLLMGILLASSIKESETRDINIKEVSACFNEGTSWGFDERVNFLRKIQNADSCQNLCLESPDCLKFTWYTLESPESLICLLYGKTTAEFTCDNCVSGPKLCQTTTTTTTTPATTTITITTTTTTTTTTTITSLNCMQWNTYFTDNQKKRCAICTGGQGATSDHLGCERINSQWQEWSQWTSCSKSCVGTDGKQGTRSRQRECTPPKYGGEPCDLNGFKELEKCGGEGRAISFCPVDGHWNNWAGWGGCSRSCGSGGTKTRRRICIPPRHGGRECNGENAEHQSCGTKSCPVHGYLDDWSSWGSCSKTCGGGTKRRTRFCNKPTHGGRDCRGNNAEETACNTQRCEKSGLRHKGFIWEDCSSDFYGKNLLIIYKWWRPSYNWYLKTGSKTNAVYGSKSSRGATWSSQKCYNRDCIRVTNKGYYQDLYIWCDHCSTHDNCILSWDKTGGKRRIGLYIVSQAGYLERKGGGYALDWYLFQIKVV